MYWNCECYTFLFWILVIECLLFLFCIIIAYVISIVQDIREHADTAEILEDFSSQAREKVNKLRAKIDVSYQISAP